MTKGCRLNPFPPYLHRSFPVMDLMGDYFEKCKRSTHNEGDNRIILNTEDTKKMRQQCIHPLTRIVNTGTWKRVNDNVNVQGDLTIVDKMASNFTVIYLRS